MGSSAESVTVTEAAPLLKTESGELSHNVSTNTLNNLPVLGIGAGAGNAGIRNPFAVLQVLPGADWRPDASIRVNGMPSNTMAFRIDGQDATNGISSSTQSQVQPSVDAIQEFAIQTSNFAAEFGQAGGGVFNVTMRSGTNQFHGTAYDYFVNEALNAGQPFTNNGSGSLLRPRQRRNDYGFTVGGPLLIPKLYDGHDKSFFFFNFEQYRETTVTNNVFRTVPVPEYRLGDFRRALTGRNVGTDGLGRALFENTVYDWKTDRLVGGVRYRDPFVNNTVPLSQQDAVALKVQSMIPQPTSSGLINNFLPTYSNSRITDIPSVKIDHNLSSSLKVSGYWSRTGTSAPNNNGFDQPITSATGTYVVAHTVRLNVDYNFTPTMLLHLGGGLINTLSDAQVTDYDPSQIGLKGFNTNLFPSIQTISNAQGGGMGTNMGVGTQITLRNYKPTSTATLMIVRNNHTFKFGAELVWQGYPAQNRTYANSWMVFSQAETGLPSLQGVSLPANVGFNYASFLAGRVSSGYISVPSRTRLGGHGYSGFAQDSWKVTRTLTLDYGLRYDFQTYLSEHGGLMPNASISTPNPSTGNSPGGTIFEGYGEGRCNCRFAKNYPRAFGPRLGLAYQITPKTVLRVGGGITYTRTSANNNKSFNTGSVNPYASGSYGDPAYNIQDGIPYKVTFPNFDPGQLPLVGTVGNPTNFIDQNAGRPARTIQWSVGLQREIFRNLVVEAEYVGNRGVWWQANTMVAVNALRPGRLAAYGLSLSNPDDLKLLASPVNSALAKTRGFGTAPYATFPVGQTVAQALRPMPGYLNLVNTWPPVGNTWYDALQVKATKRLSHGLDLTYSFTWSKQFTVGAEQDYGYFTSVTATINDVDNRRVNKYLSGYNQPLLSVIAGNYTTPTLGGNKILSMAAKDWIIGAVLRYGSGLPMRVPSATTSLATYTFQNTLVNRVPGVPLFTQDLNCHCFDPNKEFVLNPAAWANPPLGQFGTAAAYYDDYRQQRRPVESVSLARSIRFRERMSLMIRAEFTNIFNRTQMNDPTSTNAFATQTRTAGQPTAGFGWINTSSVNNPPRQGTVVARFTF
ncbi:MAG: hypothetical protein JWO19_4591 [Bryobacterales bacterium]|nr:hypothetical protein [Bryobacterales bacterium]